MLDSITTGSPSKATLAPVKNSTLTGFPINPKDDIDPGMGSNSTTSTTMPTTTTVKVQFVKPSRRTTPAKPTRQVEAMETPFVSKITSTTKYIELQDRSGIFVSLYTEEVRKII